MQALVKTQKGHRDESWAKAIFQAEPDLIAARSIDRVRRPRAPTAKRPGSRSRRSEIRTISSSTDSMRPRSIASAKKIAIPFSRIAARRTLAWNSTLPAGAPVMSLGVAIEIQGTSGGAPALHIAVVDIRLDRLIKSVSGRGVSTSYIVDEEGRVLAYPDREKVTTRAFMGDVEIVREALQAPVASQIKRFAWNGRKWVGAYASVGLGGLTVVSQVEDTQAFRAARRLIEKSRSSLCS